MLAIPPYSSDQWQRLWKPRLIERSIYRRLDSVDYTAVSGEDNLRACYYKFATALAAGINPLGNPSLSPEDRNHYSRLYDQGARIVATDLLQDAPDHLLAKRILDEGINAPRDIHTELFFRFLLREIDRFVRKYSSQLGPDSVQNT